MKINVNHPSFLTFFNNVNTTVLAHSPHIDNYFNLSLEKKMSTLYLIFKLIKSAVNLRTRLKDEELKSFITVMKTKNEDFENYEFAAALNDIINNFNSISESTVVKRKSSKTIKIDKNNNG